LSKEKNLTSWGIGPKRRFIKRLTIKALMAAMSLINARCDFFNGFLDEWQINVA
jgi:hypothetical protein